MPIENPETHPPPLSQQWSLVFWHHPSQVNGLYYRSRRDPSRYCFALYDRINPQLSVSHTINFLDHSFQSRLVTILNLYQYAFLG